jgi:hypothetical protein
VRRVLRDHFYSGQGGSREDDAGDAPKEAAEPQGQEHQHGIQPQSAADQKRLDDLALDRHERQKASGNGGYLRGTVETDEGRRADCGHRLRRRAARHRDLPRGIAQIVEAGSELRQA